VSRRNEGFIGTEDSEAAERHPNWGMRVGCSQLGRRGVCEGAFPYVDQEGEMLRPSVRENHLGRDSKDNFDREK